MKLKILMYILSSFFCVGTFKIFGNENLLSNIKLLMAVNAQNLEEVKHYINEGADLNLYLEGLLPLHLAITLANKEIVEILLLSGANIYNKIILDNKEYDAIELARWYVKACSYTLKNTESMKINSKSYQDSEDIDFVEHICKECSIRLKRYKSLVNLLEYYNNILQENLKNMKFEFCYKF